MIKLGQYQELNLACHGSKATKHCYLLKILIFGTKEAIT